MKTLANTLANIWMLQIFAEPNVQTTTLNEPGNDLSPEMKTFYNTQLLESGKPKLVHAQFGKKEPIPRGGGKRIEWRRIKSFKKAVTPLTEGVTPDGGKVNVEKIEKELRQYGDYTTQSDLLELTSIDPMISEITVRHSENMFLTMDTVTRNELQSGSNVFYAPSVAEDGTVTNHTMRAELDENAALTPDLIARVAAWLKKNNAPKIDGSYVAIIHPYQAYDLMKNEQFIDVVKYQDSMRIFDGEIGKLYGIRFVETSEAKIIKGENLTAESETVKNGATQVSASTGSATTEMTLATKIAAGDRILQASAAEPVLLNVNGVEYECVGATAGAAGSAKITIQQPHAAIAANAVIYPGGAGKNNTAVFPLLVLGKDAYGTSEVSGEAAHVIVKQLGSSGSADPLDQRSTVGWKAFYATKILQEEWLCRVECGSALSDISEAN